MVGRLLIAIAVVGLLCWLVLEPKPQDVRVALEKAKAQGFIAAITSEQLLELALILDVVRVVVPIDKPIEVAPVAVSDTRLDVVLYNEGIDQISHLGAIRPGNSAYLPRVDVMFLPADQLVRALSARFREVERMFLVLTILHELGHRQPSAGCQQMPVGSKSTERCADSFAHEKMRLIVDDPDLSRRAFGLEDTGESIRDLVALFALEIPDLYRHPEGTYSSFYRSHSHDMLIERLSGLVDSLMIGANPESLQELKFVSHLLSQYARVESPTCEVRFSAPIHDFVWSGTSLTVLSSASIETVEVFDLLSSTNDYCIHEVDASVNGPAPPDDVIAIGVEAGRLATAVTGLGEVYRYEAESWSIDRSLEGSFWRLPTTGEVASPTVLRAGDHVVVFHAFSSTIVSMHKRSVRYFELEGLVYHSCGEQTPIEPDWLIAGVDATGFYLGPATHQTSDRCIGVQRVECSGHSCRVDEYTDLRTDGIIRTPLIVVVDGASDIPRFFGVTPHNSSGVSHWEVWQLFSNDTPVRLAVHPFVRSYADALDLVFYSRYAAAVFRWAQVVDNRMLLAYGQLDPVFRIDLSSGAVSSVHLHSDVAVVSPDRSHVALGYFQDESQLRNTIYIVRIWP